MESEMEDFYSYNMYKNKDNEVANNYIEPNVNDDGDIVFCKKLDNRSQNLFDYNLHKNLDQDTDQKLPAETIKVDEILKNNNQKIKEEAEQEIDSDIREYDKAHAGVRKMSYKGFVIVSKNDASSFVNVDKESERQEKSNLKMSFSMLDFDDVRESIEIKQKSLQDRHLGNYVAANNNINLAINVANNNIIAGANSNIGIIGNSVAVNGVIIENPDNKVAEEEKVYSKNITIENNAESIIIKNSKAESLSYKSPAKENPIDQNSNAKNDNYNLIQKDKSSIRIPFAPVDDKELSVLMELSSLFHQKACGYKTSFNLDNFNNEDNQGSNAVGGIKSIDEDDLCFEIEDVSIDEELCDKLILEKFTGDNLVGNKSADGDLILGEKNIAVLSIEQKPNELNSKSSSQSKQKVEPSAKFKSDSKSEFAYAEKNKAIVFDNSINEIIKHFRNNQNNQQDFGNGVFLLEEEVLSEILNHSDVYNSLLSPDEHLNKSERIDNEESPKKISKKDLVSVPNNSMIEEDRSFAKKDLEVTEENFANKDINQTLNQELDQIIHQDIHDNLIKHSLSKSKLVDVVDVANENSDNYISKVLMDQKEFNDIDDNYEDCNECDGEVLVLENALDDVFIDKNYEGNNNEEYISSISLRSDSGDNINNTKSSYAIYNGDDGVKNNFLPNEKSGYVKSEFVNMKNSEKNSEKNNGKNLEAKIKYNDSSEDSVMKNRFLLKQNEYHNVEAKNEAKKYLDISSNYLGLNNNEARAFAKSKFDEIQQSNSNNLLVRDMDRSSLANKDKNVDEEHIGDSGKQIEHLEKDKYLGFYTKRRLGV